MAAEARRRSKRRGAPDSRDKIRLRHTIRVFMVVTDKDTQANAHVSLMASRVYSGHSSVYGCSTRQERQQGVRVRPLKGSALAVAERQRKTAIMAIEQRIITSF